MNLLITGVSGFVGRNLLPLLVSEKKFNIYAIVRNEPDSYLKSFNVNFLKGELFNLSSVKNLDIDIIIHIAGLTKTLYSKNFYKINTRGTGNLLKQFKGKGVKQFIYISSLAAFGPTEFDIPVDEISKPRPISHYGKSKLLAEKLVKKSGFPFTIIRPPAVFGPFDTDIYTYFKMVKNRFVLNAGDVQRLYSLIYVKDLGRFILSTILNKNAINQEFFISFKDFYKIGDIVRAIENACNKRSLKINLPQFFTNVIGIPMQIVYAFSNVPPLLNLDKLKEVSAKNWICSGEKARLVLNFNLEYEFFEAIEETFKWYRENNYL